MEFVLVLSVITSIGSLICLIIVLTKLFPAEGAGKGILGIICGLYTFIWGWQNKDQHNLQTVMLIWTILFVLGIILSVYANTAFR
jgi:hypothetical protein